MPAATSRILFITGSTGFIGRSVLDRLLASGVHRIVCLVRSRETEARAVDGVGGVELVYGDVCDSTTYSDALAGSDTVVHMAAATGKARESELRRVNVEGTRELVEACRRARVKRFVFMSSIAAAGDRIGDYPYARTKLEAEGIVREAGVQHTIVRPTIVLGERGGNWRMLRKLACLPVIPMLGGGAVRVQPVDVVDVARAVEVILDDRVALDPLIELGGPEVLTFADFLLRIRKACGLGSAALVRIPVGPVAALAKSARRVFGESFPVGPGQLAPFINDGAAASNAVYEQLRPGMATLDELLVRLAHA